jgi:hypothetical protein
MSSNLTHRGPTVTTSQTRIPQPKAMSSPLEQLPAELLEKILLEVVSDVKPPGSHDPYGGADRRSRTELDLGHSLASKLLVHRLVSRTLRDSSWRTLAKVIGETIFDVNSRQSMKNLQQVAKCKDLTLWLNKLTVSYFVVRNWYPTIYAENEDDLRSETVFFCGETGENQWMRIKNNDESWFPSVRKSCSMIDNAGGLNGLAQLLSSCLKTLQNLAHVNYYYDE